MFFWDGVWGGWKPNGFFRFGVQVVFLVGLYIRKYFFPNVIEPEEYPILSHEECKRNPVEKAGRLGNSYLAFTLSFIGFNLT